MIPFTILAVLATSKQQLTPVGILIIVLILLSPFVYSWMKSANVKTKFKQLLPEVIDAHKGMLESVTIRSVNPRLKSAIANEIKKYRKLSEDHTTLAITKALEVSVVLYYLNKQYDKVMSDNRFNIYLEVYIEGKMEKDIEKDPFLAESGLDSEEIIVEFVNDDEIIFNAPPVRLKQFIELVVNSKQFSGNRLVYGGTGIVYYSSRQELEVKFLERQEVFREGLNDCLLRFCGYK
ncbi:hypothetical protein GCM10009123_07280 [Kangiella japonica]|uniref:Uncharacterized protein n=1 Tax=Kangiella japonica TaxID=647384 RepID=A0ABN0SVN6_9GAMM